MMSAMVLRVSCWEPGRAFHVDGSAYENALTHFMHRLGDDSYQLTTTNVSHSIVSFEPQNALNPFFGR